MTIASLDELAGALARNRIAGDVSELPMSLLQSPDQAEDVQVAALDAFDSDFRGYAMVGTSRQVRSTLGLTEPIFSAIADKSFHEGKGRFRLPNGILGAQCELVFTIGRTYPAMGETIDRLSASAAVIACQPAIGLIGRRALPGADIRLAAIADFAFHVATLCGHSARHVDPLALDEVGIVARIDDRPVASGRTDAILGHPLETIAWLAKSLAAQGKTLNADDVVATGSCTPILQVLPGQRLMVDFDQLGPVSCAFD
ncbi:MAG TPA: fumarylacetoacetate hydrolase family protein [Rhizobiaceae bacterium]|nr:fumarylacetoacetate hydrolase family protein [Rhizobiaceae bacterium]